MKRILFTSILIFFCLSAFQTFGQDNSKKLIIRVYESTNTKTEIVVCKGEEVVDKIPLSILKSANFEEHAVTVSKVLTNYLDEGYVLVSEASGGNSVYVITTYILEKE